MQERTFAELRAKNQLPTQNKRYETRRGNFYEEIEKRTKNIPGPTKYILDTTWVSEADKERGKNKPHNTKKLTFIDEIIGEQKRQPIPGPGKYNVTKTEEQIKLEISELKTKQIKSVLPCLPALHNDNFEC